MIIKGMAEDIRNFKCSNAEIEKLLGICYELMANLPKSSLAI